MKISVLGSGAWGTAIAILLCGNGHDVTLWSAFREESELLSRSGENPYLPGVTIPREIHFTADLGHVAEAGLLVCATPSFAVRQTARALKGLVNERAPVAILSKGIEADSLKNFSQVVTEELGGGVKTAALSGPSHAEEVARGVPTANVCASLDISVAEQVQDVFMSRTFRVYSSTDLVGVHLGGALKNIFALGAGVCDGLGLGDNTIAMLMTRGLAEMATLGIALGGKRETFAGLAGVGDLIVTCCSRHSRNRRAGVLIGGGLSVSEAMEKVGATVEGYYAADAAMRLSHKTGVEMPISSETYKVLYEGKDPALVVKELMTRSKKNELENPASEKWIVEK